MAVPTWMRNLHERATRVAKRVSLGVGIFSLAAAPASPGEPRVPAALVAGRAAH